MMNHQHKVLAAQAAHPVVGGARSCAVLTWFLLIGASSACSDDEGPDDERGSTTESAGAGDSTEAPSEEGEVLYPTDETTPKTEAHPDFPNEDRMLVSPEGQRIIDEYNEDRAAKPNIRGDVGTLDQADDGEEVADEIGLSAEEEAAAACSATTMKKTHRAAMSKFLQYRKRQICDARFDWSNDGCSNVPDTGTAFDFRYSCIRHDFGYRNYKGFAIFTEGNKKRIDDKFLTDMKAHCSARAFPLKPSCYSTAYTYYAGVRALG